MDRSERRDLWGRVGRIEDKVGDLLSARESAHEDSEADEVRFMVGRSNFGRGRVVPVTDPNAVEVVRKLMRAERERHDAVLQAIDPMLEELDALLSKLEAKLGIAVETSNAG